MDQNQDSLAYRLRRSVRTHEEKDSLTLILGYPLKVMKINPFWRPVVHLLGGERFVRFEDILSLLDTAAPDRVESYLNGLVRKGFLESQGFLKLNAYPRVSIIIPVRNRPEEIAACLESLKRLDYPEGRVERIVIDDASSDRTSEVISTFPVRLITLDERRQASFCRNLGAKEAGGDILAFLDSDCLVDPLWLKALIPAFHEPQVGAVGGLVDSWFGEKGLDRYEKVKSSLNMGQWPGSSREGSPFFYVPSCNLLTRRRLFLTLNGFREDLLVGEDVDLCWRIQDQGYDVEYRPVGRVFHKHRNRIKAFCARRFEYGTSEAFLQQTHKRRIKKFPLLPSAVCFWGLGLCTVAFGWFPWLVLWGLMFLADALIRFGRIRQKALPVRFHRILLAVFRGDLAVFHTWCAFFSRYYLFWAIALIMVFPMASAVVIGMHVLMGSVEFVIKKPRLSFPLFFVYFTFDQLSYQLGVWWGCLKRFFFVPVNPRVVTSAGKSK